MRKIGPGAMVSLVVSLQRKQTCMQGKQITAGQLTNHKVQQYYYDEMQFMGSNTVGITSRHMDRYPACIHI